MNLTERYPKYSCYPPVPNWYSSNVTAVIEPHFFMYATRNYIVVLDLDSFKYFNSFIGSSDKIHAIAGHEIFCFTGGDDKVVRSWNILHGTPIALHKMHTAAITALKCIRQGNVIISGDKSGKLVVAEAFGTKRTFSTKVKSEITCISTVHYQNTDYVAVGYANGMVFVESIDENLETKTVYQLANDNDVVNSLDWQKLTSSDQWPLLATTTKRLAQICIWSFPSESKYAVLKLPPPPAQTTDQQKSSVWVKVSWSPSIPFKVYISSYIGLIVPFDVSTRGKPRICNSERFDKHGRNVFTIDWLDHGNYFISTSLDKQIIKWAVKKVKRVQTIKAQSAYPYSMDIPNWNTGQVAIGLGDNSIKLWSFSNKNLIMNSKDPNEYYSAVVFWKGLQGKIGKVKWHPNKEGVLAYGNEYGHLGLYDTMNQRSKSFRVYHKSQGTPSIAWGLNLSQILEDDEMTDTMVSCGQDGRVHAYDSNKPQAPPIDFNERLDERNKSWALIQNAKANIYRCQLGIDEQAEFIAFGNTDGIVEVYQLCTLKLIYISNCQRQKITTLEWKRIKDKVWLASGCEEGVVAIHRISDVDIDAVKDVPITQTEGYCKLKAHTKKINNMTWSSHENEALIASAADDNFVIVWNIESKEMVSLFDKHRSKVLSVCWDKIDNDKLFSGSEDRFIYHWNYRDFPCKMNEVKSRPSMHDKERQLLNNNKNKRTSEVASAVSTPNSGSNTSPSPNPNKKRKSEAASANIVGLKVSASTENSTGRYKKEHFCMTIAKTILSEQDVETARNTLLSQISEAQREDPNVVKYATIQAQESTYDLLFGDKNDMRRLIGIEVDGLYEENRSESSQLGYSLKNDLVNTECIKLALNMMRSQFSELSADETDTNSSYLMDWVTLALSPIDGKEAWLKKMKIQAEKMEKLKQYHLAATCFMACSCIYEAIDVYRRQKMYREAIALAKLRLPSVDPIITTLFSEWASILQKGEHDQLTATCFLLSKMEGSIGNAINLLARSDKESGFFWAGCLALAAKDANAEVRVKMWLDKINERYLKKASSQPKQKKAQKTQEESKGQENQETKQCPDNQDVDMEITN